MTGWFKRFIKNHIVDDEPDGPWDLYIFPGGKVGEALTRAEAIRARYRFTGEFRAISRSTGEQIIL